MPDWKKFADLLGMAQFGDEVRAEREKVRQEGIEAEELGFKRSANSRADASSAREAEEFTYGKTRRGAKEKADELALEGASIRNTGGRQDNEWNAGRQSREDADNKRKDAAEKREAQRLGISQQELQLRKQQFEADGEFRKERLSGARRENRIGDATEADTIAASRERNDPKVKDAQRLAQLVQLYKSVSDEEEAAWIMEEIKRLSVSQKAQQLQSNAANAANPDAEPITPDNVVKKWGFK